jgi:hypothetical protein
MSKLKAQNGKAQMTKLKCQKYKFEIWILDFGFCLALAF